MVRTKKEQTVIFASVRGGIGNAEIHKILKGTE